MPQPHLEHTLSARRNWIFGGYTAEYNCSCNLTSAEMSDLIDSCLSAIHKHFSSSHAVDCKGRNRHDAIITGIPGETDGELFRVGGEIASAQQGANFEWSPFEASCHSQFHEFQGAHHISYALRHHQSETVPDWLPWRLLGAAAPIRPRYFRLGIERFQSRFTWASFGYLPQVTDSLLIDALESKLVIRFVVERHRWRASDPFAEFSVYASIAAALRQALSLDMGSLFMAELSKTFGR